jgi:hypothetical protein
MFISFRDLKHIIFRLGITLRIQYLAKCIFIKHRKCGLHFLSESDRSMQEIFTKYGQVT